jgi:hypothetical protein
MAVRIVAHAFEIVRNGNLAPEGGTHSDWYSRSTS